MSESFLANPSKQYEKSIQQYALAYKKINDQFYFNKYKKTLNHFQDYLNDLHNFKKGINLHQGDVATSTYWLINKKEVVGVVRIRHQEVECAGHIGYDISPDHRNKGYGSEILNLALNKAKGLEIEDIMVTCNVNNIASKKIIEKNNGKLLGTIFDKEENEHLYKYCIALTGK